MSLKKERKARWRRIAEALKRSEAAGANQAEIRELRNAVALLADALVSYEKRS